MIIGITGSSGSGKTEFSKVLLKHISANKKAEIINADEVVRKMSEEDSIYFKEIVKLFGDDILIDSEGSKKLNKQKIADIIFNDYKKKEELDSLTFKYVVDEIKKEVDEISFKNDLDYILIDAPLLIESNLNKMCDIVISTIASKDIRTYRITKRDEIETKKAIERIEAQKDDIFYIKNSNYVVINNENENNEDKEDIRNKGNKENEEKNSLEDDAKYFLDLLENSKNLINNKEAVIIKNKDVIYLEFKRLLEFENIKHAFSLRPLDFADGKTIEEKKDLVDLNYKKMMESMTLENCDIIRPCQTHTSNVIKLGDQVGIYTSNLSDIDGLITDKTNKLLSLGFADCTPIYLYDKEKQIIGNIHSGWQGTAKKILKEAIIKMKEEFNCDPKDIICIIGPTIRKCHFEVQDDVKDIFYNKFSYMNNINEIIEYNEGKKTYYIDTVKININLLKEEGILEENIVDSDICTYCNSKFIHSFRKDKELSGRNTSLICKI